MSADINGIPAVIYGAESESVYIYVHGLNGRKEEAEDFSRIAESRGFQVVSFDLPGHGGREKNIAPTPFNTLPEINTVYSFARKNWKNISLYSVSIGAWFSLVYFHDKPVKKALLVSPVVSMKSLIERMMTNSGITAETLRERKIIPESNLSWDYYNFAAENDITRWEIDTHILYPENDNITPRFEIETFAEKFGCDLRIVPNAEHWLHTEEDLKFLREWNKEEAQKS